MSRFRRTDEGSVAVLAAVTFPLVLLCVALAIAAMVWSTSEHETQRAADAAAVRAAATAFLGTDFPYAALPDTVTYPDVAAIAGALGVPAPAGLGDCGTVGVPPVALGETLPGVPETLALPDGCAGVGPFPVPPALSLPDQSTTVACDTARAAMAPGEASFANRFYDGTGDAQPSCDDRIEVRVATGNALVGFGQRAADEVTGALETRVPPQVAALRTVLAAYGIRLDTSLPSLLCPEISVSVEQPVREPVFDRDSVPSGRATARRVVKNAVVVPVFEGRAITAAADGEVHAAASGVGVTATTATGASVTIPPANLNTTLLAAQRDLLTLLDEVDALADAAVRAAGVTVDRLNGTYAGVDPDGTLPAPAAGTEPLDGLRLTKCLRDTLGQVFDPPSGDAPTAAEVLADAAETGEQVIAVQVGAVRTACTEPGAIAYDLTLPVPTATPDCIRAATAPRLDPLTGIYEVPFFDVTPVLVQDVGDGNYAAVPVHASQASGAFRASLVRAADHELYDPALSRTPDPALCGATEPAATACGILDVPTGAPTLPVPTPTLPVPTPSPTLPVPTLTPTLPAPTLPLPTSEVPLVTTPPPTCLGPLCGVAP